MRESWLITFSEDSAMTDKTGEEGVLQGSSPYSIANEIRHDMTDQFDGGTCDLFLDPEFKKYEDI
jgi:hypothetical protein